MFIFVSMKRILIALALLAASCSQHSDVQTLFVGNYADGIYAYDFDGGRSLESFAASLGCGIDAETVRDFKDCRKSFYKLRAVLYDNRQLRRAVRAYDLH